jgi:hypothetical protein
MPAHAADRVRSFRALLSGAARACWRMGRVVSEVLTSGRMLRGPGAMAGRCGRTGVRDRWCGQRQRGQLHQQQHVVIGGCPVHPQPSAACAAVDQHPAALAADGDRYRLHTARAVSLPVTGDIAVKMPGPQAAGTVIAVGRAGGVQGDVYAAMAARKGTRKRQVW